MAAWWLRLGVVFCVLCSVIPQVAFAGNGDEESPYDWTGVYLGGHLGGVFVRDTVVGNIDGFSGGALAGYLHQYNRVVLGLEGDLYWGDLMKRGMISTLTGHQRVEWGGTVRLRAGYTHKDWLFFASAGVGTARVKVAGSNLLLTAKDKKNHWGYVVSAGLEKKVSQNWRVRAEYSFGKFGKRTYTFGPARARLSGAHGHGARVAIIYRFKPR